MKKNIFFLFLLTFSLILPSQEIKLGVKGGLNYASLLFTDDFDSSYGANFHVGFMVEIPVSDSEFSFQPELIYSRNSFNIQDLESNLEYNLDYLSLPLLAKFYLSSEINIECGPYISYLINSEVKVTTSTNDSGYLLNYYYSEYVRDFDFGFSLGLGYSLDNGLNFGARYNLGLRSSIYPLYEFVEFQRYNSLFQLSLGYFLQ